jgi:hypothetical protein
MAGGGLGVEISQIIKIARWSFSGCEVKKRTTKCEDLSRRGDIPDIHSLKTGLLSGSNLLFLTISFLNGLFFNRHEKLLSPGSGHRPNIPSGFENGSRCPRRLGLLLRLAGSRPLGLGSHIGRRHGSGD